MRIPGPCNPNFFVDTKSFVSTAAVVKWDAAKRPHEDNGDFPDVIEFVDLTKVEAGVSGIEFVYLETGLLVFENKFDELDMPDARFAELFEKLVSVM